MSKQFKRSYRVGFGSDNWDEAAINKMMGLIRMSCRVALLGELTTESLFPLDAFVSLNPFYEGDELDALMESIERGLCLFVLISPDADSQIDQSALLRRLGVSFTRKKIKNMTLRHTEAYPQARKRGSKASMVSAERKTAAFFAAGEGLAPKRLLVDAGWFGRKRVFAMEAEVGRGKVVFSNSFSLPETRAELLQSLIRAGNERKAAETESLVMAARAAFTALVDELFRTYRAVPLQKVAEKLDMDPWTFLDLEHLVPMAEDAITGGRLRAQILGDALVRPDETEARTWSKSGPAN